MDPAARLAANLSVLRRHDAAINGVLDSSSHVVVYDFDPGNKSWTKKGIEGTLFVFQRSVEPFYGLFVMNRLGLENLSVMLNSDMEVTLLQEFVIYRQPDDSVQGLWMYETSDRTRIVKTLTTYTERSAPRNHTPNVNHAPQHNHSITSTPQLHANQPVDIMAMFQRAKVVDAHGAPVDARHSPSPQQHPPPQRHQAQQLPPPPSTLLTGSSQSQVSAPPIMPQQRQIQRLEDVWQWVEDLAPQSVRGGLPDRDFRSRMLHLAQDQNFLDAMYRSYRWERPT
ncbi:uncharacterized protein EV422DRAFT_22075 [Fimicolochytrium jonesii]|uniref:uncharacterized protein n=1 Tax=Fimicolochytrium jonesii TaxID=1396493 RepID=UPI0022FEC869|nr:uncharacterized protein EV422DRAFT_22075 [Fimicolochytrium jonesii]KAI8827016.1 hypothetical protein EV422DRAFT_22075 [Fimicolochytrium jonesii]